MVFIVFAKFPPKLSDSLGLSRIWCSYEKSPPGGVGWQGSSKRTCVILSIPVAKLLPFPTLGGGGGGCGGFQRSRT
eukprot:5504160-Amphidinium_carterae.1